MIPFSPLNKRGSFDLLLPSIETNGFRKSINFPSQTSDLAKAFQSLSIEDEIAIRAGPGLSLSPSSTSSFSLNTNNIDINNNNNNLNDEIRELTFICSGLGIVPGLQFLRELLPVSPDSTVQELHLLWVDSRQEYFSIVENEIDFLESMHFEKFSVSKLKLTGSPPEVGPSSLPLPSSTSSSLLSPRFPRDELPTPRSGPPFPPPPPVGPPPLATQTKLFSKSLETLPLPRFRGSHLVVVCVPGSILPNIQQLLKQKKYPSQNILIVSTPE